MKLLESFVVQAPVQRVADALCSEGFNLEAEREREEVVDTQYVILEQNDSGMQFEIRSTEYKRKKTGGIDRSGTVQSVMHDVYRAQDHTLTWDYKGVGAKWVTVAGVYGLAPLDENRTQVEHHITIGVYIPLIGGLIAKFIAGEFKTAAGRFERLLKVHAA